MIRPEGLRVGCFVHSNKLARRYRNMNLDVDDLAPEVRRIQLNGRLDMKGTGEIELRFTGLTSTDAKHVLVDMSQVEFIASIGMRLLVSCAKAKAARGGKMVLFGTTAMVREALEMAGIDTLIPVVADETAARDSVAA